MDDPLSSTLAGDTALEETDDSTKSEPNPENKSIVFAQLVADLPVILLTPPTEPLNVKNPPAQEKNDETTEDVPASV